MSSDFTMGAKLEMADNFSKPMLAAIKSSDGFKQSATATDQIISALSTTTGVIVSVISELTDIMAQAHGITRQSTAAIDEAKTAEDAIAKSIRDTVSATEDALAPTEQATQGVSRWTAAIQQFNRGTETLKRAPATIRQIATQKLDSFEDSLISARLQAGLLVGGIQAIARSKIDGAVSGFKEFKTTVTEGKSGLAGFTTGLKNVGKISVTSAFNGIKNITAKTKEFAATKLSGIVSSIKEFGNKAGGAKGIVGTLATGIKKVAKLSLSGLVTGMSKLASAAKAAGSKIASGLGDVATKSVKGLGTAITAAAAAIGAAAAAGGAALIKLGKDALAASAETTRMNTQLAISAGNMGIDESGIQAIKDQAAALEKTTMYSSTAMTGAAAELATYFEDADAITRMMSTVTDYAAGMSGGVALTTEQIVDYTTNLAKMTTGAYDAMTKKGFEVTDAQKKILENGTDMQKVAVIEKIIAENWNGMAEAFAQTPQGKIEQFTNAWSGMKSSLGDKLYPMVGEVFGYLRECLPIVQTYIEGIADGAIGIAGNLLGAFKEGGIGGLVGEIGNLLAGAVTKVAEYVPKVMDMAVSLIGNLLTGIQNNLPAIADGASKTIVTFINGIVSLLPTLLLVGLDLILQLAEGIFNALPQMLETGKQALETLGTGIQARLPQIITLATNIIQFLVSTIVENLPLILQTGIGMLLNLVQGIIDALPYIIQTTLTVLQLLINTLVENLPAIIQMGINLLVSLIQGIVSMLPALLQMALSLIMALVQGLIENLPLIINAAVQLVVSLVQGILDMLPMLIQAAIQLIIALLVGIIENLPMLIQAAYQIVWTLIGGLIQAIPQLIAGVDQLIGAILDVIFTTNWLQVGWDIIKGIGKGLWDGIKGIFGGAGKKGGEEMVSGAVDGAESGLDAITDASTQTAANFTTGLQPDYETISSYGIEAGNSLTDGLTSSAGDLTASAMDVGVDMATGLSDGFTLTMPDVVDTATLMGTESVTGLSTGMSDTLGLATSTAENVATGVTDVFAGIDLKPSGTNAMQGFVDGMNAMSGAVISVAKEIADSVKLTINSALDIHSPSQVTEDSGEFTGEGFVKGITKMINKVRAAAKGLGEAAVVEPSYTAQTTGAINPSGAAQASHSKAEGLKIIIERLILENVGEKDPKALVREILRLLYEELSGADEVLSLGEMGALL